MTDIKKIAKLVKQAGRVEAKLSKKAKLKLARKRLIRIAGVDDPQAYTKTDKDKAKSSSEQLEDKGSKDIIKDIDDEERFIKTSKKKTKLAKDFDESEHPRDGGKFTSKGGGDSGSKDDSKDSDSKDKPDTKEKKTPAEEGTDAVLADAGFEGVNSDTLDSISEALGADDVQIEDVNEDAVAGNGRLITMDDGSEWAQYDSQEDARAAAKESMENLFDDIGIEGWNESFREQFVTVSETDARIIGGEAGDSAVEDRDANELVDMAGDFNVEVPEGITKALEDSDVIPEEDIDKLREDLSAEIGDDVERRINEDARQYFVEDEGLMSNEDFGKADFVSVDTDALFEASIDEDGIAHTLAGYDGNEVETKDGKLLYRTN